MSINHSSASCDWCRKKIDDGDDVACKKCYETDENLIYDLRNEIAELKDKIDDLLSTIPESKLESPEKEPK